MKETLDLIKYLADLKSENIPDQVFIRCQELFLDWLASVYASKTMHPIPYFEKFAIYMGPTDGKSKVLSNQMKTSPYFASFVNAAASHLVEQDDLHNSSVLHPATVVFSAALAAAQDLDIDGENFLIACIAGYEAGIRIGEFMGRSHYRIFHTTATVGTLAAAVAVGKLMNFNEVQFQNLLGSAGTQAAGLWEFLKDAADSKQLHTAKAASNGLIAAYLTREGLTGAKNILQGEQGLAAGMSNDAESYYLNDQLGDRWALLETSFKFHASCRHTHPAADALLQIMQDENIKAKDIQRITAHVHQAAIDVLGLVQIPETVHQAKFSMGTVLALIAVHGNASLNTFKEYALTDTDVIHLREKVTMVLDHDIDQQYPKKWLGKVTLETLDKKIFTKLITDPKGDPLNPLSEEELHTKFNQLCEFSNSFTPNERKNIIHTTKILRELPSLKQLF